MCQLHDLTVFPLILAGMRGRPGDTTQVTFNEGLQMAADINAEGFFECSAQTGVSYMRKILKIVCMNMHKPNRSVKLLISFFAHGLS